MYEASLKDKWDYENVLATAMRESKLEGKLEGKLETAKKMKAGGIPILQISEFTGLSVEEIKKL